MWVCAKVTELGKKPNVHVRGSSQGEEVKKKYSHEQHEEIVRYPTVPEGKISLDSQGRCSQITVHKPQRPPIQMKGGRKRAY